MSTTHKSAVPKNHYTVQEAMKLLKCSSTGAFMPLWRRLDLKPKAVRAKKGGRTRWYFSPRDVKAMLKAYHPHMKRAKKARR